MAISEQLSDLLFKLGQTVVAGMVGIGVKLFSDLKQDIMDIKIKIAAIDAVLESHIDIAGSRYEEVKKELQHLLWKEKGGGGS